MSLTVNRNDGFSLQQDSIIFQIWVGNQGLKMWGGRKPAAMCLTIWPLPFLSAYGWIPVRT